MKPLTSGTLLLILAGCANARSQEAKAPPAAMDYAPLARVLADQVDSEGFVDYVGLKQNPADLDRTIEEIERASPASAPELFPSRESRLAYWINAYNAWILRIVVDHYPVSSITRIGGIPYSAFFVMRVTLGGKKMTLHALETDVIRAGFHDPRIHFAINCASRSCPPLARQVYRPETLDRELDQAARAFINDNRQVTLDEAGRKIVLSKIFDWYASDFKDAAAAKFHHPGSVVDYLRTYLTPERQKALDQLSGVKPAYHDYDWSLNERSRR